MADNAFQALLPNISDSALAAALIRRAVYMVEDGEDTQTIDLQNALMIGYGSNFYRYDSSDTTTAHDGTSVLVDINGRRYKLAEIGPVASVLDRTDTPPGSPSYGDAYLATAGATGDWAGLDDYVMVYLGAGWRGVAPVVGWAIYVEDETAYYHYAADGSWTAGLGSFVFGVGQVSPVEDQFWGGMAVEDVLDTPPGSPTDDLAWVVGASPTGAWVGHADDIAFRRNGAWEYLPPYEGAKVWDKSQDLILTYNGSWEIPEEIQPIESELVDLGGLTSADVLDLGGYVKIDVVASVSGQTLRLRFSTDNGGTFKDGAADYFNASTSGTAAFINATSTGVTSASGFNKSSIRTMVFNSAGNSYRVVAEANNAMRLFSTAGAFDAGSKALLLKYRG